jgi:sulfate adenylyltransferase subunit 2
VTTTLNNSTVLAASLTILQQLEADSIHIIREAAAECERPVMLYSIGKDSSVMLHLARKAFFPARLPFPLLHIDTTWKFRQMIAFRDEIARRVDIDVLVHTNWEGIAMGLNPFDYGPTVYTDVMKTQALKQALEQYGFDLAFGGARRDEEKSRAKERVFSLRAPQHLWDPKQQRPELWRLYNARRCDGHSVRVFPLSNWTELDVWHYIHVEQIPVVPLYFADRRPVVRRDGTWIMVDDDRLPLAPGEAPQNKEVRFRTLGCYPLTSAIESQARSVPQIIRELLHTQHSERQGRVIDHDQSASMEKKKIDGYF